MTPVNQSNISAILPSVICSRQETMVVPLTVPVREIFKRLFFSLGKIVLQGVRCDSTLQGHISWQDSLELQCFDLFFISTYHVHHTE